MSCTRWEQSGRARWVRGKSRAAAIMAMPSLAGGFSERLWPRCAAQPGTAGPRSTAVMIPTATLLFATIPILMLKSPAGGGYSGSGGCRTLASPPGEFQSMENKGVQPPVAPLGGAPRPLALNLESHPPQHIADGLAGNQERAFPECVGQGIRPGRGIGGHTFTLQHLLHPKNVVGVADRKAVAQAVGLHDHGNALGGLHGIRALRLRDQIAVGNAQRAQVIAPHSAFAVGGIVAIAAGGDDHRGQTFVKQLIGVVEPGTVDGRRTAGILGRAKNHDGGGGTGFVVVGLPQNAAAGSPEPSCQKGENERCNPDYRVLAASPVSKISTHPSAKNLEISWLGIAPSRRTFQRASESVRSTMVEATSRGEVPPSIIMPMRFCNWSRTSTAVVHSAAPLRLAEVAVMGMPAALITATGMAAAGMRRATLPVLAVTLRGSLEAARTMMVSGPGQKRLDRA